MHHQDNANIFFFVINNSRYIKVYHTVVLILLSFGGTFKLFFHPWSLRKIKFMLIRAGTNHDSSMHRDTECTIHVSIRLVPYRDIF